MINIYKPSTLSALLLLITIASSACSVIDNPREEIKPGGNTAGSASNTIFIALGGHGGIRALSQQFIKELAGDKRLRPRFIRSDIGRFDRMFQEHLCALADGPCKYSGDSMKRTHGGMNIQSSEFNGMVAALMRAMDKQQVPVSTQNRLLARLAPMRPDIVGQ